MIDGLNYIPIENIEDLKDIWNYSISSYKRNLDNSKITHKFLNVKKLNEFHKKVDKKDKKSILLKMKNSFGKYSNLRNLEDEYNSRDIFNSSCDPITLNNISVMMENLNDDINTFSNKLKDERIIAKYNNNINYMKNYFNLVNIYEYLIKDDLSDMFEFNSSSNLNLTYIENFISFMTNDYEEKNNNIIIINNLLNNNTIKYLNELSTAIILSIYNIYSSIINQQSTVLTSDNIKNNQYYLKNIDNVKNIIQFINDQKIFSKSKKLIEDNVNSLSFEIRNQRDMLFDDINLYNENNLSYFNSKLYDDKYSVTLSKSSWSLDILETFASKFFPIKIKCPSFPPLQLRLSPLLELIAGFNIGYIEQTGKGIMSSKLIYDIYAGVDLGAKIEAGLYFDVKIAALSIAVGLKGKFYKGRIGFKLSINFMDIKTSFILIYYQNVGVSLDFYIYIKIKVLFIKITLFELHYEIELLGSGDEHVLYEDENNDIYYLL